MWSKKVFKRMPKSNLRLKKQNKQIKKKSQDGLCRWRNWHPCSKLIWNRNFFFFFKSATPAVEVSIRVPQQLFPVNVQTVYVVPSVAHVTLDPLHCLLLGQPASGCRAWFHCPCRLLIFVLIVVGWGGAGRRGGRGGGRGRWRGWRGEERPLRKRVFPRSSSSLTGRKRTGKTQIVYFHWYHFCKTARKLYT